MAKTKIYLTAVVLVNLLLVVYLLPLILLFLNIISDIPGPDELFTSLPLAILILNLFNIIFVSLLPKPLTGHAKLGLWISISALISILLLFTLSLIVVIP